MSDESTIGTTAARPRRHRSSRIQAAILTAGLIGGLAVVGIYTSIEVSSRPQFCGSCHNMQPYYQSWKTSSHRAVACVECHIPPGVTAEFRKKFEALSMVASYFTGTYGTNPWTEIDDAACLRCHERRLLAGRELFGDVIFDHTSHLAGMRRGKKLRCTSCHSQIVQGSHIAVTTSTCILCHFKGREANTGTARCTLCHPIPDKVIRQETLILDHADVGRYGMECTWCHVQPASGDGAVPRERCVTCHNDPARLKEYEHTDLLHRMHVSEHKVDCMNCHLEIEHGGPPRIEKATTACNTCHRQGHSPQMNLYAGIGGRGVEPMPDIMFLAGVRCEGCHIEIPGRKTGILGASDVSCMSCHGSSYRKIYMALMDMVDTRTSRLERQLSQTAAALGPSAAAAMADARFNLDLVVKGNGVHNPGFTTALLRKSHQVMNDTRTSGGLSELPLPWREAPYESACLRCHEGVEETGSTLFGLRFDHGPHVSAAAIECSSCHRPHDERPEGEIVRFGPSGCANCHHREPIADCHTCHGDIRGGTVASPLGDFDHAFHLDDMELGCTDCHDPSPGGAMPVNRETCANCHE